MASTQEIVDAAKKLGRMIGEHDTSRKLASALKALENNIESQRAMTDYQRFLQSLAEKEATGRPIEVSDKRKLEELQRAVVLNPILRQFQTAQMDYVDLIRKVDDAMLGQSDLAATVGMGPAATSGGGGGAESPLINPDLSGR